MRNLTTEQWLLIAGFLSAISASLSGYDHWVDLGKPAVIGGFAAQLAIMLRSLFTQTKTERGE